MRLIIGLALLAFASIAFAQKEFSELKNELGKARQSYLDGKLDEALAILDRSDTSTRATVESLDLRGRIFLEQGKFDAATKAFESAHSANYKAFAPRIHLADVMLRQKKFTEARKEYQKLLDVIEAPMWPEYLRFGILLSYLGEHDEAGARKVLAAIVFPTETPTYYYAQAAWSFAHGNKSDALKWIDTAKKIFNSPKTGWFDRALFEFGWIKKKPARIIDPFF